MELELLQTLLLAGTAVIADVLDSLDRSPAVLDNSLFSVAGPGVRFIGPAYTVAGASARWSGGGDRAKLAAIDEMTPGVVPVWAGQDIRGACCFGDLLATAMQARGCAGVVVDGGVRDLAYLQTLALPIVARYRTPAQAIGRWQVTAHQVPIQVRGGLEEWITVHPGDLIVADDDGVLCIPSALAPDVAGRVAQWSELESGARDEIRNGLPLLAALEKYGHL